jgi:hypothetical protein
MKNYELVSNAKIELCLFQQFFTPHTQPLNKARVKPPSVQTSPAHASYAQQFLSVNVPNRVAQATTRFTMLCFKSHSNTKPLNQNVGKQRKKNYGKITEISASLAFPTLPMEKR